MSIWDRRARKGVSAPRTSRCNTIETELRGSELNINSRFSESEREREARSLTDWELTLKVRNPPHAEVEQIDQ